MKTLIMQTAVKFAVIPQKSLVKVIVPRGPEVLTITPKTLIPALVPEYGTPMVQGRNDTKWD
jgi:hypothetical protein